MQTQLSVQFHQTTPNQQYTQQQFQLQTNLQRLSQLHQIEESLQNTFWNKRNEYKQLTNEFDQQRNQFISPLSFSSSSSIESIQNTFQTEILQIQRQRFAVRKELQFVKNKNEQLRSEYLKLQEKKAKKEHETIDDRRRKMMKIDQLIKEIQFIETFLTENLIIGFENITFNL